MKVAHAQFSYVMLPLDQAPVSGCVESLKDTFHMQTEMASSQELHTPLFKQPLPFPCFIFALFS